MATRHTIRSGDTVIKLAERFGLFPETIWLHPDNAELREKRKDMNILEPGDVVVIPDKEEKLQDAATTKRHVFRRRGIPALYRLQIFQESYEPYANQPFVLTVDGKEITGTTDGDGMLEVNLPPSARRGKLAVGPPPEGDEPDGRLRREVVFGELNPESGMSGVRQRLRNLGFHRVALQGERVDDDLREALFRFQHRFGLERTGEPDDATRAEVEKFHDHKSRYPDPPPIPPESPASAAPPAPIDAAGPRPYFDWEVVELVEVTVNGAGRVDGVTTATSDALPVTKTRADHRQFVNLDKKRFTTSASEPVARMQDPGEEMPAWGRKIWFRARIAKTAGSPDGDLAGRTVRFTFAETPHATRGDDGFDEAGIGRDDSRTHWDETTDDEGWTGAVPFTCSSWGGDAFRIAAQALRDGRPTGQELQTPDYEAWRKLWCQCIHLEGESYPDFPDAIENFRLRHIDLEVSETVATVPLGQAPRHSHYPAWMALNDGSVAESDDEGDCEADPQVSVLCGPTRDAFLAHGIDEHGKMLNAHVIMCRRTLKEPEPSPPHTTIMSARSIPYTIMPDVDDDLMVMKPAVDGATLVVEGTWRVVSSEERSAAPPQSWLRRTLGWMGLGQSSEPAPSPQRGMLTDAHIFPRRGRRSGKEVTIRLPDDAPDPTVYPIEVSFRVRYSKPYGGLAKYTSCVVTHNVTADAAFEQAVAHELAHLIGQVRSEHPNHYVGHGGKGPHCSTGAREEAIDDPNAAERFVYVDGGCTMFHAVADGCSRFCDDCDLALRGESIRNLRLG